MSLSSQLLTIYSASATALMPDLTLWPAYAHGVSISIENVDSSANVYIGNSNTSSSSYGFRLTPGQAFSIDLDTSSPMYAVSSTASSQVAIMRLYT